MHTKIKIPLAIILIAFFLIACKKTREPLACIDGPMSLEEEQKATYTWCGTDAQEVDWAIVDPNGVSTSGTGNTFNPSFKQKGIYTITVFARNGEKKNEKSLEVEYGKTPEIVCRIADLCGLWDTIVTQADGLMAYLYKTRADWLTCATQGNHNLALDSVQCQYSSKYGTAIARFKGSYPGNVSALVSVEGKKSDLTSNWGKLAINPGTVFEINSVNYTTSLYTTSLTKFPKRVLSKKWKVQLLRINGSDCCLPACHQDDYLKFSPNGTWTYDTGPTTNCSSADMTPSHGTFELSSLPACESSTISFKTIAGTFNPPTVFYSSIDGSMLSAPVTSTNNLQFKFVEIE